MEVPYLRGPDIREVSLILQHQQCKKPGHSSKLLGLLDRELFPYLFKPSLVPSGYVGRGWQSRLSTLPWDSMSGAGTLGCWWMPHAWLMMSTTPLDRHMPAKAGLGAGPGWSSTTSLKAARKRRAHNHPYVLQDGERMRQWWWKWIVLDCVCVWL